MADRGGYYDVVVLGGGPAGTAAAGTAARAGLRVAIVDRAAFPRDKLCGGLFTGRSLRYFEEIHGTRPPEQLIEARRRVAFSHRGRPLGEMADIPPLYLTMRWDLDAYAMDRARAAGAEPWLGQRVARVDAEAPAVVLDDDTRIAGRVLIGADGVNSAIARALFGRAFDPDTVGFALEREAEPTTPAPDTDSAIEIEFAAAEWGYGWRFPKAGSTTIGVGGLHARNPDMTARMAAFDDAPGARVKGHFLPFGDVRRVPGRGAVLLAGDAAGLVDPITGEGIAYAMKSGQLAALAAARALQDGRPDRALIHYSRALRPIRRSIRIAAGLRHLIFPDRVAPVFAASFAGSGRLKADYMRMLAGELDYPALLAGVLRRAPRILWRALRG